jgi:hypothetical protein
MTEVDFNRLPWWAIVILQVIILFKGQLGSLALSGRDYFRHKARRQTDRQDFEQDLIASQIDHQFQVESAEILTDQGREMRLMALLEKKDEWVQGKLVKEIECLHDGQNRTNELLGQIHTTLVEMKVQRR